MHTSGPCLSKIEYDQARSKWQAIDMTGTTMDGHTASQRRTQSLVTIVPKTARFVSVVLGAGGGLCEDNLSAYLLAPAGSQDFIALDAGTLLAGLRKALCKQSFGAVAVPPESDLPFRSCLIIFDFGQIGIWHIVCSWFAL